MNVAIWLLTALLALPLAEIVVFVLVAAAIGFGWTALAIIAGSLTGALMLRRGGGSHVARMRVVLGPERLSTLETDSAGTMYVLAAILLLIPGFITDVIGILLLVKPLRRAMGMLIKRAIVGDNAARRAGVVDLGPQEWRQVQERQVRDQRRDREP